MIREQVQRLWLNDWHDDDDVKVAEIVSSEVVDKWRHGVVDEIVVKELATGKFYCINYRVTADGDYNEMRDDDNFSFFEVKPITKTVTVYVPVDK